MMRTWKMASASPRSGGLVTNRSLPSETEPMARTDELRCRKSPSDRPGELLTAALATVEWAEEDAGTAKHAAILTIVEAGGTVAQTGHRLRVAAGHELGVGHAVAEADLQRQLRAHVIPSRDTRRMAQPSSRVSSTAR